MASNGWKRTLQFLGLVEDYEDEYAEVGASEPAGSTTTMTAEAPSPAAAGSGDEPSNGSASIPAPTQPTGTVNVIGGASSEKATSSGPRIADRVHVTSPTAFNDVEDVGERFRQGDPVLMNLQGASEAVAKRVLDFASGLIYGLDGSIDRTGDRIFLLTPASVDVAATEMDRLRDRGLVR
jgi:cell division inhibitor SepF